MGHPVSAGSEGFADFADFQSANAANGDFNPRSQSQSRFTTEQNSHAFIHVLFILHVCYQQVTHTDLNLQCTTFSWVNFIIADVALK